MRTRLAILLLVLPAVLLAGLLHSTAPIHAQSSGEIISLVNEFRAARGLAPLAVDGALMAAAQGHADWMAANATFSHTGAGGSSPQQRATAAGYPGYVAENFVVGTNLSPRQGLIWWENSPIHYATLVSNRYAHVGAGYARYGSQNIYVLVAGSPSGYTPPAGGGQAGRQAPEPIVVIPVTRAEPRADGAIVHVVQMGQTAWDIAAVYDVDLAELLRLNNLPDDPILFPGDEVYVLLPEGVSIPPPEPLSHTVQEGQSAWSIAARYGLTLDELLDLNGLAQDYILQPGDVIVIRLAPGQTPPPTRTPTPAPTTHTVREGDTLWSIAARHGLTLDDLLAMNGLELGAVINPGDELVIRIPSPTPPPTASPTAAPTEAPPATPSPTATATSAAALPPALTAVSTPEPGATATLPVPTPTPAPASSALRLGRDLLIGVIIIGIGLLVLAGMAGVALYERLSRR